MPRKRFKIKIRVEADWNDGRLENELTFEQAANLWFETEGKRSLEAFFTNRAVNDYSYLNNFSFGDSVDKEAYD